jgi:hypothetical protein
MGKNVQFSTDDEPNFRPRVTPIRKIGATDQVTVVILSPRIQGFNTHWDGDHTEPCLVGDSLCRLCLKKVPRKWTGFLHCFDETTREHCFIELTDFAWERLKKLAADYPSCRGLKVCFVRERKTIRSPVKATILGLEPAHRIQSPERRVEPTLRRIWGLE